MAGSVWVGGEGVGVAGAVHYAHEHSTRDYNTHAYSAGETPPQTDEHGAEARLWSVSRPGGHPAERDRRVGLEIHIMHELIKATSRHSQACIGRCNAVLPPPPVSPAVSASKGEGGWGGEVT